MTRLSRLCLTLARVLLSAWVGAAVLFVINGVLLVTSGTFDSMYRDHLSLIRFPPYYLFGFITVSLTLILLSLARGYPRKLVLGLVAIALVLMVVDYVAVYLPLEAMISPPGQVRSPQFETYHRASMKINSVHVGLCLVAALLLCRPVRRSFEVLVENEEPA